MTNPRTSRFMLFSTKLFVLLTFLTCGGNGGSGTLSTKEKLINVSETFLKELKQIAKNNKALLNILKES